MKYNQQEKIIEQVFKKELLKEAISRVQEDRDMEKTAMAYFAGQKDLRNSINMTKVRVDPSPRIEDIAANIQKTFEGFLRQRVRKSPEEIGPDGQPIQGSGKLEGIIPTPQEGIDVRVPDISPENQLTTVEGEEKQAAEPGEFQVDPQATINPNKDTSGLPSGAIYFRYGFKRSIMPDKGTPDEPSREYQTASNYLIRLQQALQEDGINFDPMSFIDEMEKNRLSLNVPFNTSSPGSKKVTPWLQAKAQEMSQAGATGAQGLVDLSNYIDWFKRQYKGNREPLSMGSRAFPLVYRSDLDNPARVFAPQVKMIANEFALTRMIAYKIASGYELNEQSLENTIEKYIFTNVKKQKEIGRLVNDQMFIMQQRKWRPQLAQMLAVYRSIEDEVRNHDTISKDLRAGEAEMELPIGDREDGKNYRARKAFGLRFIGRQHGESAAGSKRLTVELDQFKGKRVPFTNVHLQMILQNITQRNPALRRLPYQVSANEFVDPDKKLQVYGDGVSAHPSMSVQGKSAYVPPIRPRPEKEIVDGTNGKERITKVSPEGHDVYSFDYDNVNLGIKHLKSNGFAVANMLQKYGPVADQALQVISGPRFANEIEQPGGEDQLARVVRDYPRKFLGAEVFADLLRKYPDGESLQEKLGSPGSGRGRNLTFNALENYDDLQRYGYSLSKLMDIIYGIIHASNEEEFTLFDRDKKNPQRKTFKMYGQRYGTSSNVGGGGEIILSVRYAYRLGLKEFAGSEEAEEILRSEFGKARKDIGLTKNTSPGASTEHPGGPGANDMQPLTGKNPPGCTYMSNMEFFLGQSSSLPFRNSKGQFSQGRRGMFNTVKRSNDWEEILHAMRSMYKIGDIPIDEANGDFIWDINADLDTLENTIYTVIARARDRVAKEIPITVIDREGNTEVVAAGEDPSGNTTDQTSTEISENVEQDSPEVPASEEAGQDFTENEEPAETDEYSSEEATEIEPVATETEEIPDDQTTMEPVEMGESARTVDQFFETDAEQLLNNLPRQITEQQEDAILQHLREQYGSEVVDDIYGGFSAKDGTLIEPGALDKYPNDAAKRIRFMQQQLKKKEDRSLGKTQDMESILEQQNARNKYEVPAEVWQHPYLDLIPVDQYLRQRDQIVSERGRTVGLNERDIAKYQDILNPKGINPKNHPDRNPMVPEGYVAVPKAKDEFGVLDDWEISGPPQGTFNPISTETEIPETTETIQSPSKSMPMVNKPDGGKPLTIKGDPLKGKTVSRASLQERFSDLANKLDKRGHSQLADKIDYILQLLVKENIC